MKGKFIFVLVFSFVILGFPFTSFASTSSGTIDDTNRYAWSENTGWIDFGSNAGAVAVIDSALSGSAYGENIGWINLSQVSNNSEGDLSGYGWSENTGWIDFSHTIINTDGVFSGYAYGENIGNIIFNSTTAKVSTDWHPASTRVVRHNTSGYIFHPTIPLNTACKTGDSFNITTGLPCVSPTPPANPVTNCLIISTLKQNSNKKSEVKCLQTKLKIISDGIFGPKTKKAVVGFQKLNKLKPDGIVGPLTRKIINNFINN